jgi:hypothetical protein
VHLVGFIIRNIFVVVVVVVEGNLFRTILLSHTNIIRRWYVLTIDHHLQVSLCVL